MNMFAYVNIIILSILGIIHIYWAMGGMWGLKNAVPLKENGEPLFQVTSLAALVVALALFVFAYFHYASLHSSTEMKGLINTMLLMGAFVFFCRAIGEKTYVGFFKRIKNNSFAKMDTLLYSPLCIVIALFAFLTYLNS